MEKKKFNKDLFDFINNATCSFACVDAIKNKLIQKGYKQLYENEAWNFNGDKYFVIRNDASIIAFNIGKNYNSRFNLVCTHSDTPGFSFKDLGKKCFAISKLEDSEYLNKVIKETKKSTD